MIQILIPLCNNTSYKHNVCSFTRKPSLSSSWQFSFFKDLSALLNIWEVNFPKVKSLKKTSGTFQSSSSRHILFSNRYIFLVFSTSSVLAIRRTLLFLVKFTCHMFGSANESQNVSTAALRWFTNDTAHIVLIHIVSVVKSVHIFRMRNRICKSYLMAELCLYILYWTKETTNITILFRCYVANKYHYINFIVWSVFLKG